MKILQLLRDNAQRVKRPVNVTKDGADATIYIYDVISAEWGVGAMQVIEALAQAKGVETLHVHINSPGGDVFEGRAIMAALRAFDGKTVAHIDSLCASAATSIALACNEVEMSDGAFFMIHNAMTISFGNKNDLRETADTLEKIDGAIAGDYIGKTGKDEKQVREWMDAETWFTAQEAMEHGFIDRMMEPEKMPKKMPKKMEDRWNLAAFDKAPQALKEPPPEPDAPESPPPDPVAQTNNEQEPAAAGFFMSTANANRLRLSIA